MTDVRFELIIAALVGRFVVRSDLAESVVVFGWQADRFDAVKFVGQILEECLALVPPLP